MTDTAMMTYEQAKQAYSAAHAEYMKARDAYHAEKLSTAAFLAARDAMYRAIGELDQAEAALL